MISKHLETVRDILHGNHQGKAKRRQIFTDQKKRRACKEWRKTCSRLAAQSRRKMENQLFNELTALLPLDPSMDGQRDKASVIRLTIAYLHLRSLLNNSPDTCALPSQSSAGVSAKSNVRGLLGSALGGFVVLLSLNGKVIFTTSDVFTHTGISQMDFIGRSLLEFLHPCDQSEVKGILTRLIGNQGQQECEVFLRIKSAVNQKLSPWKVLQCMGKKSSSATPGSGCLVFQCRLLPVHQFIEMDAALNTNTFLSIHSPDMKFTYCHTRVVKLIGFRDSELFGQSVYQFYHPSDCQKLRMAHICLLSKGQVSTGKYRLLHRHGGYVWAETDASVVCNSHTGVPESVVCINYILSGVEHRSLAFLLEHTEQLLKPRDSLYTESQAVYLPLSAALQDREDLKYRTTATNNHSDSVTSTNPTEGDGQEVHGCSEMTHKTEECCNFNCDLCDLDLDSLAPYIPMHGEDFLLTPILDGMVDSAHYNLNHQMPNSEETIFQSMKSLTQNQQCVTYCVSNRVSDASNLISGQQCNNSLDIVHRISEVQYNNENVSAESRTYHWSTDVIKVSQYFNRTHWNYDGSTTKPCGQLGSKFRLLQDSEKRSPQHRRQQAHEMHPTPLTLPVLGRLECEVNAPLDSTSYLLQGTEITAVLDQVVSRMPWC